MGHFEHLTGLVARLAAVVVIATGLSACSGGDDPEDEVRAAIHDLHADLAKGRVGPVCEAMLPSAQAEIALAAHGKPSVCRTDLRELLSRLKTTSLKLPTTPRPQILSVSVRGCPRERHARGPRCHPMANLVRRPRRLEASARLWRISSRIRDASSGCDRPYARWRSPVQARRCRQAKPPPMRRLRFRLAWDEGAISLRSL